MKPESELSGTQAVLQATGNYGSGIFMEQVRQNKIKLLVSLSLIALIATFFVDPIAQNAAYHHFADTRTIFGVPNFWNVFSNLPFLIIGLAGAVSIISRKPAGIFPELTFAYLIFYAGIFFTGIGSAYYHVNPTNSTLVWDRLPMTIAFMAFFTIIIGEFISLKSSRKLLVPLLLAGFMSVLYWYFTETRGHGDLRFYILVQFLPIVLIPLIVRLFPSSATSTRYIWLVILAYIIAKLLETFDEQLFESITFISGHTLKHIAASLAPLILLIGIYKRKLKREPEA